MKQSAKLIAATILLTVAICTTSFAQEANAIAAIKPSHNNNSFAVKEDNSTKAEFTANPAVTAKFATLYPTATAQKWSAADDNCWVSFINNGRKANASFTIKGKLNYTITDCAMENLPAAFSKIIAKEYASYQLFNAIEITAHGTKAYQAVVEDNRSYITLKYTSEGVEEIQQVKK